MFHYQIGTAQNWKLLHKETHTHTQTINRQTDTKATVWLPWAGIGWLPDCDLGGRSALGWLHNHRKSHPSSCSSETREQTGSAATITKWQGRRWHTDSWEASGSRRVPTRTEWKRARVNWCTWKLHCHICDNVRRQLAFSCSHEPLTGISMDCLVLSYDLGTARSIIPPPLTWPQPNVLF